MGMKNGTINGRSSYDISGHISAGQRFRGDRRCPICNGAEDDARGQGQRCRGFLSSDGEWVHCSREEHAGSANLNPGSQCYQHKLKGKCPCGREHAPADPPPARSRASARRSIVAAHDYRGPDGELRYQSVRCEPKQFFCRRPAPNGGWVNDLKGVELILYRLPELLAADPSDLVVIPEGEKHVDRLRQLGFVATCNALGAGKWRDAYSEDLRARHVVILPDNDETGRKHAEKVARSLDGKAASVRVVELPGLDEKGDVIDYLDRGGTPDELRRLFEEAPFWRPTPNGNGYHHAGRNGNGRGVEIPPAVGPVASDEPINPTDLGNAGRLIKQFGDRLRYCKKWGEWLVWDGMRWRVDETGEVQRLAKQTVRLIGKEAADTEDDDERKNLLRWALQSESKKHLDAMISLAWSEPGIPIEPRQFDRDPWLLNVENGTIDLRTGSLREHRQGDLITKIAPVIYDPEATCKLWRTFLIRVMKRDEELISFLQRIAGYALTGDISEHALFFLHGTGRNGKTTFLGTLQSILGDYATTIDASLLTVKRNEDHPTGLTDLDGRRFVATEEVEDGKRLAEALVKKLTGGERVRARKMRQDNYEFDATYKLFLSANHKPEIKGTDEGIWSRIKLIPYNEFIPPNERDKDLVKKLRAEGPGILAWMVRGCREWQARGLDEPKAVLDATKGYREEMDSLADFLAECTDSFLDHETLKDQAKEKTGRLYKSYCDWAKENGIDPLSKRKFGSEMQGRGFLAGESNGQRYRFGLTLKAQTEVEAD